MNEKWFLNDVSQIEKKLKTNAASGLSRKAARSAFRAKANTYGKLFLNKKKSVFEMLRELLSDFALILLLLCALMALLFDELYLGATTLIFCIDTLFVSFIFYYRSQRSLEQVDLYFMPTAKVIRGGKLYRIAFDNVVPGDVILLEKGDIVCGDARLVLSNDLSVNMRVSESEYIPLKKHSNAIVNPNENNPYNFANVLHAGSVITEGSARAIVYATGTYTYLGAKTGGISEKRTDDVPKELGRLKAICSKISMISMICVLPFCIISLLFSNVRGGTVTLSAAFLTALAICASAMTQLCYTLCKSFFVHKIKSLANAPSPVALRSTDALDKIRNLTHLFMVDGCAVTDGVLHFESAFTGEGEQVNVEAPGNASSQYLLELAALYNIAETESLSMGISEPGKYKIGIDELISAAKIDASALKIRCPIKSYMQSVTSDSQSIIAFSDMGREGTVSISTNIDVISQCKTVLTPDGIRPFSAFAIDRVKHTLGVQDRRGKQILIFMLSAQPKHPTEADKCFAGAIILGEGIDLSAKKTIATLKAGGVKVISFIDSKGNSGPGIPDEICGSIRVTKEELIKKNLPLTYRFGEIDTYIGFDQSDIASLTKYVTKHGGSVGILGFSDYASDAIDKADVFMTCAPIVNVFSAKTEKELFELESVGRGTGTVCEQALKRRADVLFERPTAERGGIKALLSVFLATNRALRNLSDFITYLLTVQIIRIICVAFPMIFGNAILDARHILLYGLLCDVPMLLLLSSQSATRRARQPMRVKTLDNKLLFNKRTLITASAIAMFTILLPEVIDLLGLFGTHLYPVEYMFCAVLWLHLAMMLIVFVRNGKSPQMLVADKKCMSYFAFVIFFLIIVAVVTPAGLFLDWVKLPLVYFICTFIPSVLLLLAEYLLGLKRK